METKVLCWKTLQQWGWLGETIVTRTREDYNILHWYLFFRNTQCETCSQGWWNEIPPLTQVSFTVLLKSLMGFSIQSTSCQCLEKISGSLKGKKRQSWAQMGMENQCNILQLFYRRKIVRACADDSPLRIWVSSRCFVHLSLPISLIAFLEQSFQQNVELLSQQIVTSYFFHWQCSNLFMCVESRGFWVILHSLNFHKLHLFNTYPLHLFSSPNINEYILNLKFYIFYYYLSAVKTDLVKPKDFYFTHKFVWPFTKNRVTFTSAKKVHWLVLYGRLASSSSALVSVLGIKNPVHKQKLALKAMDTVLFGAPPSECQILSELRSCRCYRTIAKYRLYSEKKNRKI